MIEFNLSLLQRYRKEGYQFLKYISKGDHGIIQPLNDDKQETEDEDSENSYVIPIEDLQADEMASGINEFSFYVLS